MSFSVEILNAQSLSLRHRDEWNSLVRDRPDNLQGFDALSTWEWFDATLAAFPEARECRVVFARSGAEVVGVLPIVRSAGGIAGHCLLHANEFYGGRNGPLIRSEDPQVVRAMLDGLDCAFSGWSVLHLILTNGFDQAVRTACAQGEYRLLTNEYQSSPYFPLCASADEFAASMTRGLKQLLRTTGRKLAAVGHCEYRFHGPRADPDALLEAIFNVEKRSWKQAAGTAITTQPSQERFYRAMFPRMALAGMLRAMTLHVDGDPVAYNFGLVRGGVFCCLKHSHIETFNKLSPSYLLNLELIDRLREEGVLAYDFMALPEPHKLRWSDRVSVYERRHALLFARGPRGRAELLAYRMRGVAKMIRSRLAGAFRSDETGIQETEDGRG